MTAAAPAVSVVIPNWNGCRWLPGCLASLALQQLPAAEVIVVDNGSADDSLAYLQADHPGVRVLGLGANTGFAHAANRGIAAAASELVALINTDVELETDWLAVMCAALGDDSCVGAVACKMLQLDDRRAIYDAGDVLRRDGACVQRGRFERDDGRFDAPGDVFGACAGAAVYRRDAVLGVGGFDERYFAYLEDVDLALALRRAGWRCRYVPAVALHAGGGSSPRPGAQHFYVQRNSLLLIAKAFPVRWLPLVAYRQLSWLREAVRERRLGIHLRACAAALALLPAVLRERRRRGGRDAVPISEVIPRMPIRGPEAAGHRSRIADSWAAG
ncbi:MAG TPA: glycosyltransferase family 2 protein [Solirubrobacteraceae bacterium]|nr:glycosyltransferase family 2 protein [Solirubrobacteraceae bacterium]